uniref:Integrase, catalytic region, zinc finger, CCHC-type, peptidase aspartic, catalytic n=1 Tax=Tanacetum cinerariifolium TaxID=118510 RepID=A0A6L2JG67_TANCI|nr:integrase, catalytic region, zinc finger, CCHC-type, peptidase aspartic, catalytic [Tanacetum cinerariifolium]
MSTLVEFMILSGPDNHPPLLEKHLYDSWKSIMELYMQNKEHERMTLESVEHGLPTDVYSLVNHHRVGKDLWEIVQLLMQGTSLTKQERECKLYDAFNKFAQIKEESLHQYYLRFTQLINDMNIYNMKLEQFQVNTKFLNSLPPEWSKFVTDVKLVKDLHTTNFDQLHAYLEQYELYANEVRIMRKRNQDPLSLVVNHQMTPSHFNTYQSSYNNPQFQQQFSPSQVTVHPVQGRQSSFAAGTSRTRANISGIESLSEAWTRCKDLLQKVSHHGIDLWLQIQIFYDRIDDSIKRTIDFTVGGQLSRMNAERAWIAIEELA